LKDTIIAIKDGEHALARKIAKIQPYKKDGGFAVLMPYHGQREGYLMKVPVNYSPGLSSVNVEECIRYTADHRVKLSYHPNGFIQFSSEVPGTIRSGRDQETSEIKGLGLVTKALSDPIMTGASFGIQVWGLDDFEPLGTDGRRDVITVTEDDLYHRLCNPQTANSYLVEGFIFPQEYWAAIRKRNGRLVLTQSFIGFQASSGVMEFSIIPLHDQPILMGMLVSRMYLSTPDGLPRSGFWLSSASDSKHQLCAYYPPPPWNHPSESLNYSPEPQASPTG
jgi:hypothetical protein